MHSWGEFDMFYFGEQKCVDAEELRAGGEDSDLISRNLAVLVTEGDYNSNL